MRFKSCLLFLSLLFLTAIVKSQPCTTLGQNAATAFPACGSTTFTQTNVPICGGTTIPTTCTGGAYMDVNPFWYRFTCYTPGPLGFVLDPISNADDYDWVLFDITGRNPNDVFLDITLNVAENWSANPGNTGASAAGTSLRNCAGNTPNFSRMPSLQLGHEYLLMVSNWSASQQGYTLTFTGGMAVITDALTPAIDKVNVDCGGQQVNIIFNKQIRCNSLAADRSDFVLSPANGTIAATSGFGCLTAFDLDSAYVTFTSPLPPGNYTLTLPGGSDGNTLLDDCGSSIATGTIISFTIPPRPVLAGPTSVDINPPSDCTPVRVIVNFPEWLNCSSAAPDGSDFIVTGPSPVSVSWVPPVCTIGQTNGFNLQFTAPITVPGTYTVQVAAGSDGNTLVGECNRQVQVGTTATFIVPAQTPIPMGNVTIAQCSPTSLTLTFVDPIQCNTIAANGSDFTITGPSGVTVASAAAVNCNNGETNSITLQFASPIIVSGNYSVIAATGSDGNTLIGQCKSVTAGSNSAFTITAQPTIAMGAVTPPPCTPQSITLTFAEPINCNTIAANGSDFVVTGPSAVIISSATAVNCNANGETTSITLQFSTSILVTGTYNVQMATGSDGNTLTGQCGRQTTSGDLAPFTLAPQPSIAMGSVAQPTCLPTSITLTFADPVNCASIAANGSDFTITGPSAVLITSALATSCTNNETASITLQLSGPILTTGTFQVQMTTGSDGNTLIGQCGRAVTAGNNAPFVLPPQPAVAMGVVATPPCTPQSISLKVPEPVFCSSLTANGSDFIITGPSAVTVTSATAINCNANGMTDSITIQFSAPILTPGTYNVQMATGTDGNTLVSNCNRMVTVGSIAPFILVQQPPLPLGTITNTSCAPTSVTINFTEPLDCTSISPNGSEFIVTGPSGVIVTAATGQCNVNPNQQTITIQFAAPVIVSGTYRLEVRTGTDNNTIRGNCNRYITVGDFTEFTVPDAFPVAMDSLVPIACSPSTLKLVFRSPIRCSSIAPNGSDFIVVGPVPVAVTSATGICDANGLTTTIDVKLAAPVVRGGLYLLQLVGGSDGNTLMSDCYRQTPAGLSLSFIPKDTVSAEFQYQIQYDCKDDVITFSHDGQHDVNQWTWTVNGAAASNQQTFTQTFSAASQNTVQLAVSNGMCNDTQTENIVLNNRVTVDFIAPESICPEDTVGFVEKTTGRIDNWQWNFGNGNTSILQNPPSQVYPLVGTEMLYPVTLTISNTLGCQATTTKTVKVLSGCIIAVPTAFTPNNDGKNDHLYPINALKAESLDFRVYNRWGQLVFHSTNWTQKWDGKINGVEQATGVFVWMLNFTHKETKKKYAMKGTTTLIR